MLPVLLGLDVVISYQLAVGHYLKAARADAHRLAEDYALGNPAQHVSFGEDRGSEEHVGGLLEAGLAEDGDVSDAVYAVAVDGGEAAAGGHPVGQDGKVAVIHVDAVGLKDFLELVDEGAPSSLDS